MGKMKDKAIKEEEEMMAKLRKRFYDPGPGQTDYSAQMSFEEYIKAGLILLKKLPAAWSRVSARLPAHKSSRESFRCSRTTR